MERRKSLALALVVCGLLALTASPAMAVLFSDDFSYPDGALNGNGSWVGGSAGKVEVSSGRLTILAGADAEYPTVTFPTPLSAGPSGKFEVSVDVMQDMPAYGEPGGGTASNFWEFWVNSSGTNGDLGKFYGSYYYNTRGRIGGGTVTNPFHLLLDGQFHTLKIAVDTVANTTEFFYDNVSRGVISHAPAGDQINQLVFYHWNRPDAAGDHIYFDNLVVTPEPAALSLLALGALFISRRRARA